MVLNAIGSALVHDLRAIASGFVGLVAVAVCLQLSGLATNVDGLAVLKPSTPLNRSDAHQQSSLVEPLRSTPQRTQFRARRKTEDTEERNSSRPATCTCTCETMMVPPAAEVEASEENNQITDELAYNPWLMNYESHESPDANSAELSQQPNSGSATDYYGDETNHIGKLQKEPSREKLADELTPDLTPDGQIEDIDSIDRYAGSWGQGSRYPWTRLPDRICFRDACTSDRDCCKRYNICDRSAHVCVDCWYGSPCSSERECCIKYPHCRMPARTTNDHTPPTAGKCVDT